MPTRRIITSLALLLSACGAPDPVSLESSESLTISASRVKQVTIAPRTATLSPGDTVRFTATGIAAKGRTESVVVTWSASAGSVDDTGLFTAGDALGEVVVVARCVCSSSSGKGKKSSAVMDSVIVTIVAPVGKVETVPLLLHRMDGGSGEVLVSNGIPLPAGWLPDPSAPPVRILVNGTEVPSFVGALKGKHRDGSVMAVLVQFMWPADAAESAVLELGAPSRLPARARVDLAGALPAAAALPVDPEYLITTGVVGPTRSRALSPRSPTFFTQYESEFDRGSDSHWALNGPSWAAMNFYDRVLSHFAFWVRTGNPVLWERAARVGYSYRTEYLEANAFGSSEWWAMLDGLALHYWLTGEERSREAVYKTAESLHRSRGGEDRLANNTTHPYNDNRAQAKVLGGKVLAARLESPPFGAVSDWAAQAKLDFGWILQTQDPTGPFLFQNNCGVSSNFMTGILSSAFIAYHDYIDQDPRVLSSLQRFQDWLWDTQWLPADQVYNYYSGECSTGGPGPAWDLNGLFLEAYGWLYSKTGDAKYLERGDATFDGLVHKTWFANTKMYNQAFQYSWRYLGYRP